jgi:hypothetical protein
METSIPIKTEKLENGSNPVVDVAYVDDDDDDEGDVLMRNLQIYKQKL